MSIEDKIIHLLHKEKPRPDRQEVIDILENVLNAFKEDLEEEIRKVDEVRT